MSGDSADDDFCLRHLLTPRGLHTHERRLIDQLLQQPFRGSAQITAQLDDAEVVAEGYGDTRTLIFRVRTGAPPAPTRHTVPVDAQAADDDGMIIPVLLQVGMDGIVREIEIYRADGEPIQRDHISDLQEVSVYEEKP